MATEKTNSNGNGITNLKWMIGFIVTGMFFLTGNVVANDKLSRDRDTIIKDCISEMQKEIVQRLTRIETKIEKE